MASVLQFIAATELCADFRGAPSSTTVCGFMIYTDKYLHLFLTIQWSEFSDIVPILQTITELLIFLNYIFYNFLSLNRKIYCNSH